MSTRYWNPLKHPTDPLKWKKPCGVAVSVRNDLFRADVTNEQIDRVFAVMALCPQHTFTIHTTAGGDARWGTYARRHDVGLRWGAACNAGVSALSGGKRRITTGEMAYWTRHGLPNVVVCGS